MHVGLIIYGRLDERSGGFLYDSQLVAALRAQGVRVTVISLPWSNYGAHLLHNVSPALRRRLRDAPFDLLLQDELNHPSLFWLNRWLAHRPPLVAIVHHLRVSETWPAWQRPFYRWVERAYLRRIDGFIYNSRTTRATVAALVGEAAHVVAPPGGNRLRAALTADEIVARAYAAGPLRLLFVGNLMPRKGLHTLLAALARVPRALWRLDVVGETAVAPAYTHQIRRQLAAAGLQTQVMLHGRLPDAALAQRFAAGHVLAVPAAYEGFGIVYLEGMAFGLPALAAAAGGAGEIITQGETGYLLPPDPRALAAIVHRLATDRALLARLSVGAYGRFQQHPTWQQSMHRVLPFLQSLVDSH